MTDIISRLGIGDILSEDSVTTTQVTGNRVTITETTTVDRDGGTILTDVNYIPFMRGIPIDFIAYNMRPTRQVHYYFDEKDVSHFIQRPNVLKLDVRNNTRGMTTGARESVSVAGGEAIVYLNETDVDTANTTLYVQHLTSPDTAIVVGNTVTGLSSGAIGNVVSYIHQSGIARAGSNVTNILLSLDANSTTDNYYNGNVITLMDGQSSNIVSYNAASRIANVNPAFSAVGANTIYSIGDSRSSWSSNNRQAHYTTRKGFVVGTYWNPDPSSNTNFRFYTGDRVFRILDNPANDLNDYTTRADYRFTSNGLEVETAQIINRTITTNVATTTARVVPPPRPRGRGRVERGGTCFTGETLVLMADGSEKPIKDVVVGDRVMDPKGGYNTVKGIETPALEDRSLWAINGGTPFVTDEHPLLLNTGGWACFDPSNWSNFHTIDGEKVTRQIVVGDELVTADGVILIESIEREDADAELTVYNLILDGSHMYYANGYVVHNKDDPTAQQFFVPADLYPEGVFITSLDLYFKNKDSIMPIEVQLRPMVNGVPDSYHVLPGASVVLEPEDVRVSDLPNTANSLTATNFKFPSPVYLSPGLDYAFVVLTNSHEYDFFVAELGENTLGTNRKVSTQPYLGSMFKSQNSITYTPIQSETVMFKLNKAVFSTSGSVSFNEQKLSNYNSDGNSNTVFDLFQVHSDAAELPGTSINFEYKATSNSNNTMDGAYTAFKPDIDTEVPIRKIVYGPDIATDSFEMKVTLSTDNTDVSPIIWKNRQNLIAVENIINNMGVENTSVIVANTGTNYHAVNTSIVFSGLTGSGANGYVTTSGGQITGVIMDATGSGYFDNVTCTITSTSGTGGSILVNTETGKSGGLALMRHISKPVTLADGFEAGDLRVRLTVSKPPQSNVQVYYKVLNALDAETLEDKPWSKMAQKTSIYSISKNLEKIELEFAPSLTSNNITYSSGSANYITFNQYQIKIVGSSSGTGPRDIPYVHDAISVALPADEF